MRKVLSAMIISVLVSAMFTGCSNSRSNSQSPAQNAGKTEKETVTPYFEANETVYQFIEMGKSYDYVTRCFYGQGEETVGQLKITNYQTFASDDTHEAKEGWEWKSVEYEIVYSDENAKRFGPAHAVLGADYYDCDKFNKSIRDKRTSSFAFVINHNGKDVRGTFDDYGDGKSWEWTDGISTIRRNVIVHLPAGYDGFILGFYNFANNYGNMPDYDYSLADEDTLLFRLK